MDPTAYKSHKVRCAKGLEIDLKLLTTKDIPKLIETYRHLPDSDRSMLQSHVLESGFVEEVKHQIERNLVHRIVAWADNQIVASLAVYPGTMSWTEHTCTVRVIVHKEFRRFGIARIMMEEAIRVAKDYHLEVLYAYLMPEQEAAINLVKSLGFQREATLKDHVKDEYGRYHDMRIYSRDLEQPNKAMEQYLTNVSSYGDGA